MLASLRWLKDYVDIEATPEELAEKLTMAGFEVESIENVSPGFSGVVVGKLVDIKPHPNADKLSLCDVMTDDATYHVVCGAHNINVGDVVPLAKVGAVIPGGYTIKKSKLRGEVSEGMLCSEEELGIGEDMTGIMQLDKATPLGGDLATVLDLHDTVFDISITPNRPDCLSILGIAREIAAITGKQLRYPELHFEETDEDVNDVTSVEIQSPHLCPRYTARIIKNINIKPSPAWMRMRLEAVGLRPINNVVDVTNFVMMELGQPLHSFDFRYLEEGRIVVRGAQEGEEFVSLDEKARTLRGDTLMICDGVKPVAIAGVMGGLNSEVVDDTRTVLLESAYFNPVSIRKTARALGMGTDAAFRFERGVDPEGVIRALNRAAYLLKNIADATVCKNVIDQYPQKIHPVTDIPLRIDKIEQVLGTFIENKKIQDILESLEMNVTGNGGAKYFVTPPTFRVDIEREIDLIEEIARLYGYDNISVSLPVLSVEAEARNIHNIVEEKARTILNGAGFSEVITYSFTTPASAEILRCSKNNEVCEFVNIKNPLTEETSVMRTGLVYGLLEGLKKNMNVGNTDLKIFEIGKIFRKRKNEVLPQENRKLGLLLAGYGSGGQFHYKGITADFYDLKGVLENLFEVLRIKGISFDTAVEEPFLHPGKACSISFDGKQIGFAGEVHPEVLLKFDIQGKAFVSEISMSMLAASYCEDVRYREIPKFPPTSRDVAFIVDEKMEAEVMLSLAYGDREKILEDAAIFDIYTGKGIPEGKKSMAVRFTYRSFERTLTDSEVNKVHNAIVENIIQKTNATIRGMGT